MKNVLIIYGGKSCEHDISIITACLAKGYFANHNVYCVYLDKSNRAFLAPNGLSPAQHVECKLPLQASFAFGEKTLCLIKRNRVVKRVTIDAVVNCCHGAHGEDGTIAALCGLLNVPLVGSDITASAVAMDKILSKQVLQALGLPVVDGFEVNAGNVSRLDELTAGVSYPLIVKPDTLGSSIGVAVCRNFDELSSAVRAALRYDSRALVETALTDFYELNCAAMRVEGSVVTSRVDVPVTAHDILTFEDKYVNGTVQEQAKPEVDCEIVNHVKTLTEEIYGKICFGGVIRVDYLFDNAKGKLYVNEINSIPGSLAYGLFSDRFSMTEYGDRLLEQAERDYAERADLVTAFSSSVLNVGNGKHRKK